MLQSSLIFGIQKQIKEGRQANKIIEESEEITEAVEEHSTKELLLENVYAPSILAGIHHKAQEAEKKDEAKKALVTEAFHLHKAEKKLNKDFAYFNYLYENFVEESARPDFEIILESIFEDTIRLYQECDVTPRVISPAIDSNELSESQIVDLYKNSLNESIKNNYTKPMLSGKITELYEGEIRTLTKKLIEENVDVDMDQIRVYMPFEETLYQFNRQVLIPETAESRIKSFMESTTEDYLDLLEETAEDILRNIEKKIKLLTSLVSPGMFDKAVDAEGIDAPKMAGVTIAVDKNFSDPDGDGVGTCQKEISISSDTDPEAAEEFADEDEAEEIEKETEDINAAEEESRNEADLANDVVEYEDGSREDEAEESAAEESAEHEQPAAAELDLALSDGSPDENGMVVNTGDTALEGAGNDNGVDDGVDATLPGDVPSPGELTDPAAGGEGNDSDESIADKEDVSEETPESEEDKDEEDKDKKEIEEGTVQDKKPAPQNTSGKEGSMPGGGTTQDKGIAGAKGGAGNSESSLPKGITQDKNLAKSQGGAGSKEGSMPDGKVDQDKNISKAKNTSNNKGSMPDGKIVQDKGIAGSKGGAPNKAGSMPGGGTTQDKNLSKKQG